MAIALRNDYIGLWFMPEATAGTNPGIIAATPVDGTTETDKFQPETATYRAFARMMSAPENLPVIEMKAIDQVYQTNDFDQRHIPGLKTVQPFTLTFAMCSALPGKSATYKPTPPPWLRFAGSACGVTLGYKAAHKGGAITTVALGTDEDTWTVTAGALDPGHLVAVDTGTGTSTQAWKVVRPTSVTSATALPAAGSFLYPPPALASGGVSFGAGTAEPTTADKVLFAVQAVCDKRFENVSESYTFLFPRAEAKTWQIIKGCRATSWEFEDNPNEVPKIKITFVGMSWTHYNGSTDADWTTAPSNYFRLASGTSETTGVGIFEEPAYYAQWPCPRISNDAQFAYVADTEGGAAAVVRTLDIASFKVSWSAGFKPYMATTATEGTAAQLSTEKQELRVTVKCLYAPDFRDLLSAAISSNVLDTFAMAYWAGSASGTAPANGDTVSSLWAFFLTTAFLIKDPGFQTDIENNQAMELTFGMGAFRGDLFNATLTGFDTTGATSRDTKFALAAFA